MVRVGYFIILGIVGVLFAYKWLKLNRTALLAGVIFTTFHLSALPLHLSPLDGAGLIIHVLLISGAIAVELSRRRAIPSLMGSPFVVAVLAFTFLVFGYVIGSPSVEYGLQKSVLFVLKALLPFLVVILYAPLDRSRSRAVLLALVVGMVLTALSMLVFASNSSVVNLSRLSVSEELSPISAGRSVGYGAVVLLLGLMYSRARHRYSWLVACGLVLGLAAMLATGTRGPLIGLAAAGLGTFILLPVALKRKLRILLGTSVVVCVVWIGLYQYGYAERLEVIGGYTRISNYLEAFGENTSDVERLVRYEVAAETIVKSSGVGLGTGGYSSVYGYQEREYPHNAFLEILVEQGLAGLFLFLLTLLMVMRSILSGYRDTSIGIEEAALVGIWIFALFNAMVSGDIADNGIVWVASALVWTRFTCGKSKKLNYSAG